MDKDNKEIEKQKSKPTGDNLALWVSWVVTGILVAVLVSILFWQPILAQELTGANDVAEFVAVEPVSEASSSILAEMPSFEGEIHETFLVRYPETQTIAPTVLRSETVEYEVIAGDSVFSIANKFDIKPETVLWSNFDVLRDDPHSLHVGQVLRIPPTDGILYEWKEGDSLEDVARDFRASADDILIWHGNRLDLTDPEIEPGKVVMIPGGRREFQQWVVPTIPVGRAGVYAGIPGGCEVSGPGLYGGGFFQWPTDNRYLSGNDYWSGHLAIDIAAATGAPIYAADSGVVVFAGWLGGYGNMIMIDHRNGYHTLYAHLSSMNVSCGAGVVQGNIIGRAGSTGNSTGPHLHFEVRYMGGFLNPWTVLP